jgi:hypothetical protein
VNNPFVDDMALHLADSIMNHWNQLKLSPRAPQHKAHIQVAIIQAINEALEAASEDKV